MVPARDSYHHGDLRRALVDAGVRMARDGGADAVVLREATRQAGVTARAAYRHFADRLALLRAVAQAALAEMGTAIVRGQQGACDAAELLRRVGLGYLRFAWDEPGWFDVAFFAMGEPVGAHGDAGTSHPPGSEPAAVSGPAATPSAEPYRLLQGALAGVVADGLLAPERAPAAALLCWSGVHGFATLSSRGPLAGLPREVRDAQGRQLVDDLVAAVIAPPSSGSAISR